MLVRNERVEIKKRVHDREQRWRLKLVLIELMTGKPRLFVTNSYISQSMACAMFWMGNSST
jgi:hypothetical protein